VTTVAGQAQVKSYTLAEAEALAVLNSTEVLNAKLDVESADHKVWETTAIGLPQVSVEGNFQHFLDIPTQVIPAQAFNPFAPTDQLIGVQFGTDYTTNASVQVNQLIFDGRYLVGLKAIKMFKKVNEQGLAKSEKVAKENCREAYYMVVAANELVKVVNTSFEKVKKLQGDIDILVEEGMVESTEAEQMMLTVAGVQNAVTNATKQQALALNYLKLKMGMTLTAEIEVSEDLETFVGQTDVATMSAVPFSASQNLDMQMLETQLAMDRFTVQSEQAANLPTFGAFFSHSQHAYRNEMNFLAKEPWYPATLWGLKLSIPVFSSGQRHAKIQQAKIIVQKAENNIGALDLGLQLQTMKAKVDLESANDVFTNEKVSIEIAEKILANTNIKLKTGVATGMDLTQAQNQLLNRQTNYVNAAYQLLLAKLELEKLTTK
jgi:outer membrane protein TolC